jgi:hypothetical protein
VDVLERKHKQFPKNDLLEKLYLDTKAQLDARKRMERENTRAQFKREQERVEREITRLREEIFKKQAELETLRDKERVTIVDG